MLGQDLLLRPSPRHVTWCRLPTELELTSSIGDDVATQPGETNHFEYFDFLRLRGEMFQETRMLTLSLASIHTSQKNL